jgi:hypothetical protein
LSSSRHFAYGETVTKLHDWWRRNSREPNVGMGLNRNDELLSTRSLLRSGGLLESDGFTVAKITVSRAFAQRKSLGYLEGRSMTARVPLGKPSYTRSRFSLY